MNGRLCLWSPPCQKEFVASQVRLAKWRRLSGGIRMMNAASASRVRRTVGCTYVCGSMTWLMPSWYQHTLRSFEVPGFSRTTAVWTRGGLGPACSIRPVASAFLVNWLMKSWCFGLIAGKRAVRMARSLRSAFGSSRKRMGRMPVMAGRLGFSSNLSPCLRSVVSSALRCSAVVPLDALAEAVSLSAVACVMAAVPAPVLAALAVRVADSMLMVVASFSGAAFGPPLGGSTVMVRVTMSMVVLPSASAPSRTPTGRPGMTTAVVVASGALVPPAPTASSRTSTSGCGGARLPSAKRSVGPRRPVSCRPRSPAICGEMAVTAEPVSTQAVAVRRALVVGFVSSVRILGVEPVLAVKTHCESSVLSSSPSSGSCGLVGAAPVMRAICLRSRAVSLCICSSIPAALAASCSRRARSSSSACWKKEWLTVSPAPGAARAPRGSGAPLSVRARCSGFLCGFFFRSV